MLLLLQPMLIARRALSHDPVGRLASTCISTRSKGRQPRLAQRLLQRVCQRGL